MRLVGSRGLLLKGFVRYVDLVARQQDVRIWPFFLEVGVLWVVVDSPPIRKTVVQRNARQVLALLDGVHFTQETSLLS